MKFVLKTSIGLFASIAFALGTTGCSNGDSNDSPVAAVDSVLVLSTNPTHSSTDVPINRKVTATFSEAMDSTSVTTTSFTLTAASGTAVAGSVTAVTTSESPAFTFSPTASLTPSTVYTAKLSKSIINLKGSPLAADYSWSFTTGAAADADAVAPAASSNNPEPVALNVPVNRGLSVIFSEPMDPTTITAQTFGVVGPNNTVVAGTVTYSGSTATFHPTHSLEANTVYTVTLTTGVRDLAGISLANALVWTFTTGSAAAQGPSPVALGTAGSFVILAKSAISTTGTTAIVGNIGLSPAAQSYLTGFSESLDSTNVFASSILVTGKMFAADMAVPTPANLTTAVADMEIAYTDAAGRKIPDYVELGAGDVSGKTLVPGLYKWGTGLLMTADVTLAGGGDDVWIFQIAQDLTVANGVQLKLSGGAVAKNIFWQVAGQVTLGTTSEFKGNILSQTQIALKTGAVLKGRALAQTAVTTDANAISKPAP